MTKQKTALTRQSSAETEAITVKFFQLIRDDETDYCHRDEGWNDDDRINSLADNLVLEGQQTPFLIAFVEQFEHLDGKTYARYVVIGGNRRFEAESKAIRDNLDPARFHENMDVPCVLVKKGEDQSDEAFKTDLLIKSVGDNTQRADYSDTERLRIVKRFFDAKVNKVRAASALNLSETQYDRLESLVKTGWMYQLVVDRCLGQTDACNLLKSIKDHKSRETEFRQVLNKTIAKFRKELEEKRQKRKQMGKSLSSSEDRVAWFIADQGLVAHWQKCFKDEVPFEIPKSLPFGIEVTKERLTVKAVNAVVSKIKASDVEEMLAQMEESKDDLQKLARKLRKEEAEAGELTEEERQEEEERIRELVAKRKAARLGQPAEDFHKVGEPTDAN